ncbi:Inositol 2-dehydrogenase [Planctomycetes bacterium Poly30]|uniref:Inositol 2-dehydrogenase n=1 Tax=Saltatorellus ferox TaxID=2528018 RepID=A0A518F146_9BACT|nr:Inositol 2-dehydrogenase [Planctomycetes bacterium Poly30]
MQPIRRREFLRHSAASAAVFAAPSIRMGRRASDDLRIGVVGVRGRGSNHIDAYEQIEGVQVVAVCDVDASVLEQRAKQLGDKTGRNIAKFTDLRDMLAKGEIDAVSIATPNHLHALHTIWSLAAGKDVYVEKPISHSVWEGQQMVAAARKYGRIVQTGTQARSSTAIQEAIAWLDAGELGAKTHAWGTCFKPRMSIGKVDGPQPIPESVDFALYQGPVGVQPLERRQLHYDWHWQHATGNGDLGNQGIHQVDQARWGLGQADLPEAVISIGGRFGYDDDGDTANTVVTFYDYRPAPMIFEVRGLPHDQAAQENGETWRRAMDRRLGASIGAVVHAEEGYLLLTADYSSARAFDAAGKEVKVWKGSENHFQNFVDAVRQQDASLIRGRVEDGHVSAGLCHMGNDSLALGKAASREEIERAVASEPALAHAFDRMMAHLDLNGIDLANTPLTFGASLRFDTTTGRYIDNDAANRHMRGVYAEGFEVPEIS